MLQIQNQDQVQNLNQHFPNSKTSPKSEETEFSKTSFFLQLKMLATKKTRFACAPPVFLSKETRYWLLKALGGSQYVYIYLYTYDNGLL